MRPEGNPSLPGALPAARLSMALPSSSTVGSASSSSMIGQRVNGFYGIGSHRVFSGVEVRVMLHPSIHLLFHVSDYFPYSEFEGAVLLWVGPKAFLMPSYIPRMLPVRDASWISSLK